MLYTIQIYHEDTLIYTAETEDPFAHMSELKRKTFSGPSSPNDVEGWDFYRSTVRNVIKSYYNNGGTLKITTERNGI